MDAAEAAGLHAEIVKAALGSAVYSQIRIAI
jgi:hypothetical protein